MEIQLYDYQEEMRQRIEAEFKKHRSLMVQMPTGTGKTYLLAAVVMDFIRKTRGHVWIVTHRRELVQQVKNTLKRFRSPSHDSELLKENASVYSIQWLTRHYQKLQEKPVLIVIDEAHHAVAKTYSTVINVFPDSRILGLTATPCRMNGEPFTDLFEELLQSWTLSQFISKGRLSLYDYMSLRPDNADAKKILGLQRRGIDGDFSTREMASKLDVKPSIGRLCDSVLQYAKGKKGIVYAINIQHAEHIAEFYRENGIKAVAISSKTPVKMRDDVVRRFKATPTDTTELSDNDIQVVVNCDLWGEGFDVPDAEFIQLARPTLSLSKYLQMVGRGLRVFGGKKYCLILDNVGSYRLFGLPSDDRDWEAMFDGRIAGKGDLNNFLTPNEQDLLDKEEKSDTADDKTEMVMLMGHKGLQGDLKENLGYKVILYKKERLYGIADANGKTVLPCKYGRINLRPNAIAQLFDVNGKESDWPWIDLITGIRFQLQPEVIRKDWLEITTRDFFKFYPRVKSGWIDKESYTMKDNLDCGVSDGLHFRNFYIQPSEPRKLYKFVERLDDKTLYVDESGRYFVRTDYELPLKEADKEEWNQNKEARNQLIAQAERIDERYNAYWDDNRKEVNDASTIQEIGYLKFQVYKEFYRVIMPKWEHKPVSLSGKTFKISWLIRSQIRVYDDICFLGKSHIIMKARPHVIFNIYKRYVDGRRFDVEFVAYPSERYYCRRLFYDGVNPPVLGNTDIPSPYDLKHENDEDYWGV